MSRESISLPSSSVPSKWPGVPMGLSLFTMLILLGSSSPNQGANMASATNTSRMKAQTIATGSRFRRHRMDTQKLRDTFLGLRGTLGLAIVELLLTGSATEFNGIDWLIITTPLIYV